MTWSIQVVCCITTTCVPLATEDLEQMKSNGISCQLWLAHKATTGAHQDAIHPSIAETAHQNGALPGRGALIVNVAEALRACSL